MKKYWWVWAYGLFALLILLIVEHQWQCGYLVKTWIKLPLFTFVPWLMIKGFIKEDGIPLFKLEHWGYVVLAIGFVSAGIMIGFFLVKSMIDIDGIQMDLMSRMAIGPRMIVLVALYTTFINSFVEEYFFRGFLFLSIGEKVDKRAVYVLSAALFALYHVTIFLTWFTIPLMMVAVIGLFIGGLIFNWFAHKTGSLLGSWMVHIGADATIMVIAFYFLSILK